MIASIFHELLAKEMTRKEFIFHVGLLFLTLTGITGLLKTLANPHIAHKQPITGFGRGTYGS
jgi:hypothetical protein